ncbi:hypothetical protein [Microlunatus sp. GCM10028923]|uniref:hypothetical protein n=1 Tax=Microlunatus sp. GCM10028923 TaxID=3273400 RepID=UPI003621957C
MGLLVETVIEADLDLLWQRTQRSDQHQRWDLRFGSIDDLPSDGPGAPQRFRYATRIGPGLVIAGTGVTAADRHHPDGGATSVLRFGSPHPCCPIRTGQGYWSYRPDGGTVRFRTGYDYQPRWGRFGRWFDLLVFRPLMAWATAWSFDRLRLWCERGIPPERSLRQAWFEVAVRSAAVALAVGLAVALRSPYPLVLVVAAIGLPPLPTTPAARRCHYHPGRCRCRRTANATKE